MMNAALTFGILFWCIVGTAHAMSIPTNIPRNKLSAVDVAYLLHKDTNKTWLNSELETYSVMKELDDLSPIDVAKFPLAPIILRGSDMRKEVAFSFDDGPHPAYTPDLISILVQYHIPATMFVVGTQVERYPYLVKEEEDDGLIIGDHTYHHYSLTKMPKQYIGPELQGCGDVIEQITGKRPTLFRPPGGDYSPDVARVAGRLGFTTVMWTVDPGDFNRPAASVIVARTLGKVSNGSIILLHDGIPETMQALPLIFDYLRINGYKIVSIDQLLRERREDLLQSEIEAKLAKSPNLLPQPLDDAPINQFDIKE
jgi:peptidoglycan/xylan/chitin deacetylase (PgdA/CDA1 family)